MSNLSSPTSFETVQAVVHLKRGREKPVSQRHPWIFSGAIDRVDGTVEPGGLVDVVNARGKWLATGYYNSSSQIVVRLVTWERGQPVDIAFWRERLTRAVAARSALAADEETNAYRLVHAESDGLPGLIVERYDEWLVTQFLTLGMDARRDQILDLLVELLAPRGIVDRSDVAVRHHEGLPLRVEVARGEPPPPELVIREHGLIFPADLVDGQKTGFYLDQRENRRIVGTHAAGRRVLNAFSYTGAFGVCALQNEAAHVTNIDSAYDALVDAEAAMRLNGFDPDLQAEAIVGDVFQVLRALRDEGRQFDLVILDPPKFASRKSEVTGATRGYKDINLLALQLLTPDGLLATSTCSGLVSPDLFQKVVFGASVDVKRDVQVLAKLSQGPDHPILLSFPEGEYLKGLLCRVL